MSKNSDIKQIQFGEYFEKDDNEFKFKTKPEEFSNENLFEDIRQELYNTFVKRKSPDEIRELLYRELLQNFCFVFINKLDIDTCFNDFFNYFFKIC